MTDMRGSKVSDPQNLEFLFQDFDGFFTSLDSLSNFLSFLTTNIFSLSYARCSSLVIAKEAVHVFAVGDIADHYCSEAYESTGLC
jgi:hypothetical protein